MAKKKSKPEFVDDGRTIANMNVEGMRWYDPSRPSAGGAANDARRNAQTPAPNETLQLTKKERRAMMRAAVWMALKLALILTGGFTVAMLLLWLWLR